MLVAAVCALASPAQAQAQAAVRYAAPGASGTTPCTSISVPCPAQLAIDVADPGDTVELAAGEYDLSGGGLTVNQRIVLRGVAGSNPPPTLQRAASHHLSVGTGASGIEVRHLQFQATGGPGGPMIENHAQNATYDGLTATASATSGPVGLHAFANVAVGAGTVNVSNSVFNLQTSAGDGVVHQSSAAELRLRAVAITRTGAGMTLGPGLRAASGRVDADGLTITTDQARCMWLEVTSAPSHVIRNATFTQNGAGTTTSEQCIQIDRTGTYENLTVNAPDTSGVAAVRVSDAPSGGQANNTIVRNLTVTSRDIGLFVGGVVNFQLRRAKILAGVELGNPQAAVVTSDTLGVLSDLIAHSVGSGGSAGFAATGFAEPDVRNLTAISAGSAPALLAEGQSRVTAKNTIARAYGTGMDVGTASFGQLRLTNSNYADANPAGGLITDFGGRQTADPLFANPTPPDPLLADFHVQSGSPVIDAGIADPLNGLTDVDGDVRGTDTPDIGADEFRKPAPPAGGGGGGGGTSEPPPPPPAPPEPATAAPPAPAPSQLVPGPVVTISASAVRVTKTGVANIRIGCPATAAGACTGTLVLQTATRVRPAQARRVLRLGSRSFRIAAGRQAFVGVKLTKGALRLLRRDKRIRVKAIANVRDANGASRITQRLLSLKLR